MPPEAEAEAEAEAEQQNSQEQAGGEQQQQQLADERAANTPVKDWREGITDKQLRDDAGKYTSLTEMAKSNRSLRTKLNDAIFLPEKDNDPESVAKFRKKLGVPTSVEGYAVNPPDGQVYDEGDKAVIEDFAAVALEHNIPVKAFEAFMHTLTERAQGLRESVVEEIESARDGAEDELAKEWGNDFDKNVQLATRAAKAHGGDGFVKFLNGTKVEGFGLLGDHPAMVRFLANIGSKSDEHDMVLQSTSSERATVQQRIDQIYEQHPIGSDGYKSKRVQEELAGLFTKLHGDKPVTGATQ